jgi:UDP-glucose 4-epimerase
LLSRIRRRLNEFLGWTAQRNLADIVASAWAWMQNLYFSVMDAGMALGAERD